MRNEKEHQIDVRTQKQQRKEGRRPSRPLCPPTCCLCFPLHASVRRGDPFPAPRSPRIDCPLLITNFPNELFPRHSASLGSSRSSFRFGFLCLLDLDTAAQLIHPSLPLSHGPRIPFSWKVSRGSPSSSLLLQLPAQPQLEPWPLYVTILLQVFADLSPRLDLDCLRPGMIMVQSSLRHQCFAIPATQWVLSDA